MIDSKQQESVLKIGDVGDQGIGTQGGITGKQFTQRVIGMGFGDI